MFFFFQNKTEELTEQVATTNTTQRELEKVQHNVTALERRLQVTGNDVEFLRNTLRQSEASAKEAADASRLQRQEWEQQQKQLVQQRGDVLTAYKSQLLLLDNLKRQNVCLEQSRGIQVAEKEFLQMLQQKNVAH